MPQFGHNEEAYTYDTVDHRVDAIVCGDRAQVVSLFRLRGFKSIVDRTTRSECWVVERNACNQDACGLAGEIEFVGFIENWLYDHFDEAKAAFIQTLESVLV